MGKSLLGGFLAGMGKEFLRQGDQQREERLKELEMAHQLGRDVLQQSFQSGEDEKGRGFTSGEAEKDRVFRGEETDRKIASEEQRAKEANAAHIGAANISAGAQLEAHRMDNEARSQLELVKGKQEYSLQELKNKGVLEVAREGTDRTLLKSELLVEGRLQEIDAKGLNKLAEIDATGLWKGKAIDKVGDIKKYLQESKQDFDTGYLAQTLASKEKIANDHEAGVDARYAAYLDADSAKAALRHSEAQDKMRTLLDLADKNNISKEGIASLHAEARKYAVDEKTQSALDQIAAKGVTEANLMQVQKDLGIGIARQGKGIDLRPEDKRVELGLKERSVANDEQKRIDAMTRFVDAAKLKTDLDQSRGDLQRTLVDMKATAKSKEMKEKSYENTATKAMTSASAGGFFNEDMYNDMMRARYPGVFASKPQPGQPVEKLSTTGPIGLLNSLGTTKEQPTPPAPLVRQQQQQADGDIATDRTGKKFIRDSSSSTGWRVYQ